MQLSNSDAQLEHLAERLFEAKNAEREATAARIEIEEEILILVPAREEGSDSRLLSNGLKLKTIGKLIYKVDLEKLIQLTAARPDGFKPVKTELKADDTILKAIRAQRPDLWREIADAITTKPAKTAVTVEKK
jgi:hypothetical protein